MLINDELRALNTMLRQSRHIRENDYHFSHPDNYVALFILISFPLLSL